MPDPIIVPRNVDALLAKIRTPKQKKLATPTPPVRKPIEFEEEEELGKTQAARTEAGQWRKKYRAAEAKVAELTASLESEQQARQKAEADLKDALPRAEEWRKHEHIERTKLLADLPPELKTQAKDMSLQHLRLFVGRQEGGTKSGAGTNTGKVTGATVTADDLDKMDSKAINEHFDKVLKGEAAAASAK